MAFPQVSPRVICCARFASFLKVKPSKNPTKLPENCVMFKNTFLTKFRILYTFKMSNFKGYRDKASKQLF